MATTGILNFSELVSTTEFPTESSTFELTTSATEKLPLLPGYGYDIIFLIHLSLSTFGFVGNGLAVMIFLKHKQLRSPTNTFIMNLIFCDWLMGCISFISVSAAFTHGWKYSYSMCAFEGFSVYFLGLTQMYLVCAVSLDRYVVIAKPLSASNITHRVALLCTSVCWLFGFIWAAFPLIGWNEYALEGVEINCSVIWKSDSFFYTSYIFAIFIACFAIPVALMVFAYYNVYMAVKNVTRNNVWDLKSRVARRNLRVEKKMLKTCVAMVGIFVFSWTPYTVVSFIAAFGAPDAVSPIMGTLPALVAKSAGIWNPLIYVATNKQFRYGFYAMLPCKELKDKFIKKEEERPESSKESDLDEDDKTKETKAGPSGTHGGVNAVAPARDDETVDPEATVIEDVEDTALETDQIELKEVKK